ncbi:MAG: SRPBCC domain-containing protein, partial [Hyphomicrobium sp.]|nr:SRPBCC domain-containing protein [Hyphomicrobium sp.]
SVPGKTSANADVFEGQFVELVPDARIVERIEFQSDDPAFAGAMTITTTLVAVTDGTRVDIVCGNVPEGISAADHQAGMASTLANLAAYTE